MTERSQLHADTAGEVIRVLDVAMEHKFGRRVGIGVFLFDLGEEAGYLGWAANANRADTATLLVEWLGTNEPEILRQAVERWRAQGILGPGAERSQ